MAKENGMLAGLVGAVLSLLRPEGGPSPTPAAPGGAAPAPRSDSTPRVAPTARGASISGTQTVEVRPPAASVLQITYAPQRDGDPDAGEVIWTWVPYDENDGRGKDRPVLVIARHSAERVYGVRLTSKSHQGDRDFLSIGSGPWDSQGRESWVDIEQVYSVHTRGMRREASALDLEQFTRVASALHKRYGWGVGG